MLGIEDSASFHLSCKLVGARQEPELKADLLTLLKAFVTFEQIDFEEDEDDEYRFDFRSRNFVPTPDEVCLDQEYGRTKNVQTRRG